MCLPLTSSWAHQTCRPFFLDKTKKNRKTKPRARCATCTTPPQPLGLARCAGWPQCSGAITSAINALMPEQLAAAGTLALLPCAQPAVQQQVEQQIGLRAEPLAHCFGDVQQDDTIHSPAAPPHPTAPSSHLFLIGVTEKEHEAISRGLDKSLRILAARLSRKTPFASTSFPKPVLVPEHTLSQTHVAWCMRSTQNLQLHRPSLCNVALQPRKLARKSLHPHVFKCPLPTWAASEPSTHHLFGSQASCMPGQVWPRFYSHF